MIAAIDEQDHRALAAMLGILGAAARVAARRRADHGARPSSIMRGGHVSA
jgi:heme A synthase